MSGTSKIDAWWAANPGKHQQAATVILVLWLGGLGAGIIAVGIDSATSITHDFMFETRFGDPGARYSYHFQISSVEYQRYLGMSHEVVYVTDYARFCDATGLYPIAKQIKDSCGPFASSEQVLQALLSFVQDKPTPNSVHYALDPSAYEYPKYPLETLGNGSGDCEDLAILFASLAEVLGYETLLVLSVGHAFAAVQMTFIPTLMATPDAFTFEGRTYLPCECTGYGYVVGKLAVPWDDVLGVLPVSIVDPVGLSVVSWVLPISAGVVVVVIVLVVRKRNKRMVQHVNNP